MEKFCIQAIKGAKKEELEDAKVRKQNIKWMADYKKSLTPEELTELNNVMKKAHLVVKKREKVAKELLEAKKEE